MEIIKLNSYDEWCRYRTSGVGASEVPTFLGYNPYQSKIELWARKIGQDYSPIRNLRMLYGQATEDFSDKLYAHWGGNVENTLANIDSNRHTNLVCRWPQYQYLISNEFPHLFVSPDRGVGGISISNCPTALEIKQTGYQTLQRYVNGWAIYHEIQLRTQMAVWRKESGVLFYLIEREDAKKFDFVRNGYIVDNISEADLSFLIKEFWDKVLEARKLQAQAAHARMNGNMKLYAELQQQIDMLEPEPDGVLAYESYVTPKFYEPQNRILKPDYKGSEADYILALDYIRNLEELKIAEEKKQFSKNKILAICKDKSDFRVTFEKGQYIEVNATKAGIKIKHKGF
jgi:YqaJ-like viral recombinase domain